MVLIHRNRAAITRANTLSWISSHRINEMAKLKFRLSDPDQPRAESVNATELGKGRYRIENIPFYARDVSLGDIVAGEQEDGELWFKRVVEKSGNGTMRLLSDEGFDSGPGSEALEELKAKGFTFEFLGNKITAASIPKGFENLEWLEGYLQPRVNEKFFYEISDW